MAFESGNPSLEAPTSTLASPYAGFSCPFEEFDRMFAELVAAEYASEVVRQFLRRFEGALSQEGKGIPALLSSLANAQLGFDFAWSAEIGNIHRAVLMDDAGQALRAAAALCVASMVQGAVTSWEIRLPVPSTFLWDNWLLPPSDHLSAVGTGDHATITSSLQGESKQFSFTANRDRRGWDCDARDDLERLVQLNTAEGSITLLPRRAAKDCGFADKGGKIRGLYSDDLVKSIHLSLDLLRQSGSAYHSWVTRGVRCVAIKESPQDILDSGTHPKLHRAVYVSNNLQPLAIAEMLVHEASHQYYDFVCLLGATVEPSITRLYYSPVAGFPRSLEHILMAYHAFANVMLFYVDSIDKGLDRDGVLAGFRRQAAADLRQLAQPLRNESALTPIGRALISPLMERATLME